MPTVIAVTPNPALDLSMTVDKLQPHATHRIATAKRKLGGKGLNVANVCAEQGYQAVALGPLSSADKEAYADHPDTGLHTGVEAAFSPTPQPVRCTWAIYEKTTNATYILNEPGFEHAREVWDDVVARVDKHVARDPHSVVTVSGSLPPGTPPELVESLIAAAHRAGGKIIVDTSGPMLRTACRAGADLVKPNAAELEEATGISELSDAAQALLDDGAKKVLVSRGAEGLVLVTAEGVTQAVLDEELEGNPTGAGDAVVAAVATALMDDLDATDLLRRAVAWSAAAVTQPVAGAIGTQWTALSDRVIVTAR